MTLPRLLVTLAIAALLAACSNTVKTTRSESTPVASAKTYRSVLVIAGGANMFLKEDAEQAVVAMIEKHGADATEGMTVMGNRTRIDREVVEPYLASGKYDAVLFMRATQVSPGEAVPNWFVPYAYGATLDNYYGYAMMSYLAPGRVEGAEGVALATMFDVGERKAVWSESMKLTNPGNSDKMIGKITGTIERGLSRANLLPGK
jgi:hypothetical protein